MVWICRLLFLFLAIAPLWPQGDQWEFIGVPAIKVESTPGHSIRIELSARDAQEHTCRIVRRAGRFYWASRYQRELVRRREGAYMLYWAMDGSGYVKVADVPGASTPEANYVESMHYQLGNLTYWGKTVEGAPFSR